MLRGKAIESMWRNKRMEKKRTSSVMMMMMMMMKMMMMRRRKKYHMSLNCFEFVAHNRLSK